MQAETVGVHLLLLTEPSTIAIPGSARVLLTQGIQRSVKEAKGELYATHVHSDHIHVLMACKTDDVATDAIERILHTSAETLELVEPLLTLQTEVHVTLLPPWHLEILASFIRDQTEFHKRFTVHEELEHVFLPNMQGTAAGSVIASSN